jgi:transcriptional regulator with XRE-family HTH domain
VPPAHGATTRLDSRPSRTPTSAASGSAHKQLQGLGLSQHEIAGRCGRDVSWVSRRLQLLSALPDAALVGVREGRLSSWAASRVVAPLARANAEHADRLLQALSGAPLSTRELRCWFEHYQGASRATRERLVSHPQLFVQAR